ncbi:hypothetical protein [Agrobacterium tumefaciens]|uniref:hypothetical protein n=1 Tax=Agrobacterium tumefaciens TaxID=358 RepID=UPI0015747AA4
MTTVDTGRAGTIRLEFLIVLMIETDIIATMTAETGDTRENGAIAGITAVIIVTVPADLLTLKCTA